MKGKKILSVSLASLLTVTTISFSNVEAESVEPSNIEVGNENEIAPAAIPVNPKTMLEPPSQGGEWVGPNSTSNVSYSGNTRTDNTTAAGIATIIAGVAGLGGASAVMTIATIIYDRNASTTYYDQYNYVSDTTTTPSVQTATVTYYYTSSDRSPASYAGRAVSYGTMTESLPEQ